MISLISTGAAGSLLTAATQANQLDTGATAWMLTSASLVLLMTPAVAFFYGGMSRTKSVLNMLMMSFGVIAVIAVIYPLWGWSESFGSGGGAGGWISSPFDQFALRGSFDGAAVDDYGVPGWVNVAFQMTFAIITIALVCGSLAERVKFSTWLVFTALWGTFTYFPLAHMVWGGGFLSGAENGLAAALFGVSDGAANVAPLDFAGGTVVHINAGMAGLVLALIIGKRPGFGKVAMRPHNLPMVMLGSAGLFFGWYGFNAGSAFTANALAGLAWLNTTIATGAAMLGWMLTERIRDGHPTSLGAASAIVAGLVAITPGAGFVDPIGAGIIGFLAGIICCLACALKFKLGYDDSLDVVGVHGVGGFTGTLLIGFFGTETGLFYGGGWRQLIVQIVVALAAIIYSGVTTLIIALALKYTMGWRITPEEETRGIDIVEHAETAYDTPVTAGRLA